MAVSAVAGLKFLGRWGGGGEGVYMTSAAGASFDGGPWKSSSGRFSNMGSLK